MANTFTPAPSGYFTLLDADGATISGGKIKVYVAGLATLATTYADADGAAANTNPVVADAEGRVVMFLPAGAYDFEYQDATGAILYTVPDIQAVPSASGNLDVSGVMGVTVDAGDVVYLSDGSGSLTAGLWYKADADLTYASTLPLQVGFAVAAVTVSGSGTVRLGGRVTGLSGLTVGTTYYASATAGALTSTAPANARVVGVADSTSSLVVSPSTASLSLNTELTLTAGEALAAGDVAYVSDGSGALTAGRLYKSDADLPYASAAAVLVGMVPTAIASGASGILRVAGRLTGLAGLTAGLPYYVSATAGALTATAPVNRRLVGLADSTTSLCFQTVQPTPDAILHSSSGTSTAAGATSVVSVAIAAGLLTSKDTLRVRVRHGSTTQATATPLIYNGTDSVTIAQVSTLTAGQGAVWEAVIGRRQTAATAIVTLASNSVAGSSGAVGGTAATFTTVWEGAWSLELRHSGVTAGGTYDYAIEVRLERG